MKKEGLDKHRSIDLISYQNDGKGCTAIAAMSLLSECGLRVQGADLPQARFTETTAASCFSLDLVLGLFLFAGLTESGLRAWLGPGRRRGWGVKGESGLDGPRGAVPGG